MIMRQETKPINRSTVPQLLPEAWRKALIRLRSEKEQLLSKLNLELHSHDFAGAEQEADYPSQDEIRDMQFSHLEMHYIRLFKINEALERIETGTFGRCLHCGERIENQRLQADPVLALCLSCQHNNEGDFKSSSL